MVLKALVKNNEMRSPLNEGEDEIYSNMLRLSVHYVWVEPEQFSDSKLEPLLQFRFWLCFQGWIFSNNWFVTGGGAKTTLFTWTNNQISPPCMSTLNQNTPHLTCVTVLLMTKSCFCYRHSKVSIYILGFVFYLDNVRLTCVVGLVIVWTTPPWSQTSNGRVIAV